MAVCCLSDTVFSALLTIRTMSLFPVIAIACISPPAATMRPVNTSMMESSRWFFCIAKSLAQVMMRKFITKTGSLSIAAERILKTFLHRIIALSIF